jgi:phosphohistidine phosphatase SixA
MAKKKETVAEFLARQKHPLIDGIEAVRAIIKGVEPEISEEIKWNAPSYNLKGEYLLTFNLRPRDKIHLVWHNPLVSEVMSDLLEGDYVDRRMTYFTSLAEIRSKKKDLESALKQLIALTRNSKGG